MEDVRYVIFDTVKIGLGVNKLTFFQQTIGTAGDTKTNMKSSGMLPAGDTMLISEIRCRIFNIDGKSIFANPATTDIPYPINTIAAGGSWKFRYEPNTVYEGHLTEFFETLGIQKDGAATSLAVSALPATEQYFSVKFGRYPLMVDSGRNFSIEVNCTAPATAIGGFDATLATGTYMQFQLIGLKRRIA
jgi:hypothetical protein